jgi:hypothetical protein
MKKTLRPVVLIVLALVLGAVAASALSLAPVCKAPAVPLTPATAVATAQPAPVPAVAATAQPAVDLFMPAPKAAAICPQIGCVNNEYCSRDRDCTTAPGGTCNLFCPKQGCCVYP